MVVAARPRYRCSGARKIDPAFRSRAASRLLFVCANGERTRLGFRRRSTIDPDKTYFVVEHDGELIGCGGWSKRKTLFGNDHQTGRDDAELNPALDPARVRAFFIHPAWARRGIGRAILDACEKAIRAAGFHSIELAATLPGVPFYASCAYSAADHYDVPLNNGLPLPVVRMTKNLPSTVPGGAAGENSR
jgi:GNAT superfamily N-acetyltransferase